MKILFVVYEDVNNEARSIEMIEACVKMGETTVVTYYENEKYKDKVKFHLSKKKHNGNRRYSQFYLLARKIILKNDYDVIVLHDNYTAPLINLIKRKKKNTKIVFDSSELDIKTKPTSIKDFFAKYFQFSEKRNLRKCDVIIAANQERANIMVEYFKLKKKTLIFDNMHRIDDEYNPILVNEKYKELLKMKKIILYGGGISDTRKTYELAEAVGNLGPEFNLVVIGMATKEQKEKFMEMKKIYNNIDYLGFVPRPEFKFLLEIAYISVSMFDMNCANTINCASGKTYESLFAGVPMLTSINPPLKRLCEEHGVGVSTTNLKEGILTIDKNMEKFRKNVVEYVKSTNYEKRVDRLCEDILKELKS